MKARALIVSLKTNSCLSLKLKKSKVLNFVKVIAISFLTNLLYNSRESVFSFFLAKSGFLAWLLTISEYVSYMNQG